MAVEFELTSPRAQAHGAAELVDAAELTQLVDDAVGRAWVELAGVGVGQPAEVATLLNASRLHPQADPEVGNFVFTRVADGVEHPLNAALAEPARDQNAVKAFELRFTFALAIFRVFGFQSFGFHPGQVELEIRRHRTTAQRLLQ